MEILKLIPEEWTKRLKGRRMVILPAINLSLLKVLERTWALEYYGGWLPVLVC